MTEADKLNQIVLLILFGLEDTSTMEISEAMLPKALHPKLPIQIQIQRKNALYPVIEVENDFATITTEKPRMIPVVRRESIKHVERSIAESSSIDSIDEILNRDMESMDVQDIESESI